MARRIGAYSNFVFFAKIVLPLTAIVLLATVFLFTTEQTLENGFQFSSADLSSLASGMQVVKPRFSGSNEKGDTYSFSADSMQPDSPQPDRIDVIGLSGQIDFFSGISAQITAGKAELLRKTDSMRLFDDVMIVMSDGLRASTSGLMANFGNGSLISDGKVSANGPMGRIEAGSMRVETIIDGEEENRMIWFENGVTLSFKPEYWADEEAESE